MCVLYRHSERVLDQLCGFLKFSVEEVLDIYDTVDDSSDVRYGLLHIL